MRRKSMGSWREYKKTFSSSENIFQIARSGDAYRLKDFLNSNLKTDINQKNHRGYSPLMISVYNSNHEVSRMLLEEGADPNSSDFSGNTVLMGAAFKGDVELVILLVNRGAKLDRRNNNGITAEQWARGFGRHNVVSILSTNANSSKFQNMMLAAKIIWGFLKPTSGKEATV
jgi:ankyrin repeat protein